MNQEQLTPPGPVGIGDVQPSGSIQFFSTVAEPSTEVLRLSRHGVWANPDIPVDAAAQAVLAAIEFNIKLMVERAVEEEREECAKAVERIGQHGIVTQCAAAIRARRTD